MCFHNGGNWPSVVRIFLTIGAAMRALHRDEVWVLVGNGWELYSIFDYGRISDAKYLLLVTHPDWPARARDGEITIRTNELLTHAHDVLVFLEVISFSLQSCPPGLPWLVAFCF